jgi:hypothetical protein
LKHAPLKLQNAIFTYSIVYGILEAMKTAKKITVHIPEDLLVKAQKSTGQGITETVRLGLQLVAASRAYQQLKSLRGKVKFSVSVDKLREDRE